MQLDVSIEVIQQAVVQREKDSVIRFLESKISYCQKLYENALTYGNMQSIDFDLNDLSWIHLFYGCIKSTSANQINEDVTQLLTVEHEKLLRLTFTERELKRLSNCLSGGTGEVISNLSESKLIELAIEFKIFSRCFMCKNSSYIKDSSGFKSCAVELTEQEICESCDDFEFRSREKVNE